MKKLFAHFFHCRYNDFWMGTYTEFEYRAYEEGNFRAVPVGVKR
jgi:hypothetical protein